MTGNFKKIIYSICDCIGSFLLRAGLSLVAESEGYSSCGRAPHCSGFPCCGGAPALGAQPSVAVMHWLSCSVACGIFPDQRLIKPMSPALAGRFLFPVPPEK